MPLKPWAKPLWAGLCIYERAHRLVGDAVASSLLEVVHVLVISLVLRRVTLIGFHCWSDPRDVGLFINHLFIY